MDIVNASPSVEMIDACADNENVVTIAAAQDIVPATTIQPIVAACTVQYIVAVGGDKTVVLTVPQYLGVNLRVAKQNEPLDVFKRVFSDPKAVVKLPGLHIH